VIDVNPLLLKSIDRAVVSCENPAHCPTDGWYCVRVMWPRLVVGARANEQSPECDGVRCSSYVDAEVVDALKARKGIECDQLLVPALQVVIGQNMMLASSCWGVAVYDDHVTNRPDGHERIVDRLQLALALSKNRSFRYIQNKPLGGGHVLRWTGCHRPAGGC
jgi:hypothetical protein